MDSIEDKRTVLCKLTTTPMDEDCPCLTSSLPGYGSRGSIYVVNREL